MKIKLYILITIWSLSHSLNAETYIRLNQHGYHPNDPKIAVIASDLPLSESTFSIIDSRDIIIFKGKLSNDIGPYANFKHTYFADFTLVRMEGVYNFSYNEQTTPSFKVGYDIYKSLPDSLLRYFRVQRCGDENALLHRACHLKDASKLIEDGDIKKGIDMIGGWHDAGDYIKFTTTTAFSCYLMALSYQYNPSIFKDIDQNGKIDLIEELIYGLKWLIKTHYTKNKIITQVQDNSDHTVGWRLPEDDPLTEQRAAYSQATKAHFGLLSATFSIASQVLNSIGEKSLAKQCRQHSEQLYHEVKYAPDSISCNDELRYYDPTYKDNLSLAATELYLLNKDEKYLKEAITLINEEQYGFWVSWGDLIGLVYARLCSNNLECRQKLEQLLIYYDSLSTKNPFGYPLESFPWGSLSNQVGIGSLALLYNLNCQSDRFIDLAIKQRDFILGRNPHNISFISELGWDFPKNFHHQISFIKRISLPGAVAEGYIDRRVFENSGIILSDDDRFKLFQWSDAVYYDDRADFLCNEPTIAQNAQTMFFFAIYNLLSNN